MNRQVAWMINQRGVQSFYHFTPYLNLENILSFGLISKDEIQKRLWNGSIGFFSSLDSGRWEGRTDCVCLSVSFPNYKMLYTKQKEDPNCPFVLLELDARPFLSADNTSMAFFPTNAAKGRSKNNPITDEEFVEHGKLEWARRMFSPEGRSSLIPSSCTTDPQAEILFKGTIDPSVIKRCIVKDISDRNRVLDYVEHKDVQVDERFFSRRADYQIWKKG